MYIYTHVEFGAIFSGRNILFLGWGGGEARVSNLFGMGMEMEMDATFGASSNSEKKKKEEVLCDWNCGGGF